MEWRDQALILGGRRFGESGLILDVLTETKGRRSGLVYGGSSRKKRAQFEPGNTVELSWSARLEEQLGRFTVAEIVTSRAGRYLDLTGLDPETLRAGLGDPSVLASCLDFLANHEPDLVRAAEALAVSPEELIAAREHLSPRSPTE